MKEAMVEHTETRRPHADVESQSDDKLNSDVL